MWFRDTMSLVRVLVHVTKFLIKVRALLPLVRESERVLARTKKGLESAWRDFKTTWYTRLKFILFINTPGTGLLFQT